MSKRLLRCGTITSIKTNRPQAKFCHVGDSKLKIANLASFQDASFAGRLAGFKINVRRCHCAHLDHTRFFPLSWMCKKQTAVSHSSAEPENVSPGAGLRVDGLPAQQFGSVCWKHFPVSQGKP